MDCIHELGQLPKTTKCMHRFLMLNQKDERKIKTSLVLSLRMELYFCTPVSPPVITQSKTSKKTFLNKVTIERCFCLRLYSKFENGG